MYETSIVVGSIIIYILVYETSIVVGSIFTSFALVSSQKQPLLQIQL